MPFKFVLPHRNQKLFKSIKEFTLKRQVGSGAFSTVHEAVHNRSGKKYAVKKINLDNINLLDQENIVKEIEVHSQLSHKNIIKLYDYFKEGKLVYLILEYSRKGNLFRYLNCNLAKSEDELKKFFKQTCLAIQYMHEHGIINRDLKPENLLLDDQHNIKICDFGWACSLYENEYRKLKAGTIAYMSPECLMGKLQGKSTDIWSLGVLLYELHFNKEPYIGISVKDQLKKVKEGKINFKNKIAENLQQLIMDMLQYHPKKRIKIEEVLKSSYLNGFDENLVGPYGAKLHPQFQKRNSKQLKTPRQERKEPKQKLSNKSFVNLKSFNDMNKKIRTYKSSNMTKAKKKVNHSTIESFQHRRTEKQPKKENLFNDPRAYQKRKTQELIVTSKPLTIKRTSSLARRIVIQRSPSKDISIEPVRELKPKNDYSLNIYKRALNTPDQKREDNVYRRDNRNTRSFYELNRINTLGRTESIDSLKVMKRMPSRGKTIINLSSKEFNIINKNNINPYKNLYKHNAKDLSPSSISFRRIEQSPNRIDERSFNMYDRIKKMKS